MCDCFTAVKEAKEKSNRECDETAEKCPLEEHPAIVVTEITFSGIADIWYARIPDSGSYLLPSAADATPAHKHFSPAQIRPASSTPHWRRDATGGGAEFSWPAVYLRSGVAGAPTPQLVASFEADPRVSLAAKIRAETADGVTLAEKTVSLRNGVATGVVFDLQNLPVTAKRFDGIEFQWTYQTGSDPAKRANTTRHTLFVVDRWPEKASNRYRDQYLWEVFEWSCAWADGRTGHQAIIDAVWGHFSPARSPHDTGLVYWKNYHIGIRPAQDLATAIQSQDHPNALQQNAASCIVFDRVLLNCLSVHGIKCAEVTIQPDPTPFVRKGTTLQATSWHATTTVGQGNPNAPPGWSNHWIADVAVPGSRWRIYDASYGAGPADPQAPVSGTVDVFSYEPLAVAYFRGRQLSAVIGGPAADVSHIPRDASKAVPPHLRGDVLWKT